MANPTTSLPLFVLSIVALTALGVGIEKYRRSRALKLSDDEEGGWQMLDRLEREVMIAGGRVRASAMERQKSMVGPGTHRAEERKETKQIKLVHLEEVDVVDEEAVRRRGREDEIREMNTSQDGELRRRRSQDVHSDTDEDWRWGLPLIDIEDPQEKSVETETEMDVVDGQISKRTHIESRPRDDGQKENWKPINVENAIEMKLLKPSIAIVDDDSQRLVDLEECLTSNPSLSSSYVPLVDIGKDTPEPIVDIGVLDNRDGPLVDVSPSPSSSDSLPFDDPWRPHPRINILMNETETMPPDIVPLVPSHSDSLHSPTDIKVDHDDDTLLASPDEGSPIMAIEKSPATQDLFDDGEEAIKFDILPPTPIPVLVPMPTSLASHLGDDLAILTHIMTHASPESPNSPSESLRDNDGEFQDTVSVISTPALISPVVGKHDDILPDTSITNPLHISTSFVFPSPSAVSEDDSDFYEALSNSPSPTPLSTHSSDDPRLPTICPSLPTPPTTPKPLPFQIRDMNIHVDKEKTHTTRPAWSIRASDAPPLGIASTTKPSKQSPTSNTKTSPSPTTSTSEPKSLAPISSRRGSYVSMLAFDLALAMQLRPGTGIGADPAWMVRYLMAMFGWFAILMAGRNEMRPRVSQL
jgi:hypothetical protein